MKFSQKVKDGIRNFIVEKRCDLRCIEKIEEFYVSYQGFRTVYTCSELTGYPPKVCQEVERYLINKGRLGAYTFGKNMPPQKFMREYILNNFGGIDYSSSILEVGPGDNPIFEEKEFHNWVGIDKGYDGSDRNGGIKFHEFSWGKGKYQKIFCGGWENIVETCIDNNIEKEYDLLCGSHSFEHNFKPVTALKGAGRLLKKDGILVLFVPDAWSLNLSNKDFTHTLYLVPDMIEEFFELSDCFYDLSYKSFRPNLDIVITAKRR